MSVTDQAFVTLATNDIYCQGALVLGQSLRRHRLTRKLVVLITPQVSSLLRVILSKVFDEVIEVNLIDSADYIHLAFLKRPELGLTLTKLHCWTLTHYSKCVFLDADTLVLSNVDELFDRGEFSAAPDPGWPDCFNSGVFVFQPSLHTHKLLLQHAMEHGSFDGADQGLLNSFFRNWSTTDIHKHLPFIYNLSSNTMYTYSPAFKQFGSSAKVVHFLGSMKPWNYKYNPQSGSVLEQGSASSSQHQAAFLHLWWTVYQNNVLPLYKSVQAGEARASPGHTLCRSDVGGPCADSASGVGEPCENSTPSAGVPCANSPLGSNQPAQGLPEPTQIVDETLSLPEGRRSEDYVQQPAATRGSSAGFIHSKRLQCPLDIFGMAPNPHPILKGQYCRKEEGGKKISRIGESLVSRAQNKTQEEMKITLAGRSCPCLGSAGDSRWPFCCLFEHELKAKGKMRGNDPQLG
ncbi:glycogenin-2 isoform X3 [Pan troglodytes]|uniref:glycogenin-2 isoform X3 n=1 Tax=Pan troglodytes TaxID=9598 RepID=UPI000D0A5E10|nr:glycogenin-2 isoform X3 [Pan troglodytes]